MNPSSVHSAVTASLARRFFVSLLRIGGLVLVLLLVLGSLLTFPAHLPGMIAVWLGLATALTFAGRRAWPTLVGCAIIVIVKRVDGSPGVWICLASMLAVAAALHLVRETRPDRLAIAYLAIVWLAWIGLAWDWHRSSHANHSVAPLDGRPIVCIGDSLTSYPPHGGYPRVLGRLIAVPVINLGAPGITSSEALKQLPKLKAARPQAVVIELGGHDFLKDPSWLKTASRAATKRNLEQLIAAARSLQAEVLLMEVPRGFIVDPFAGLDRELAREQDLELISDTAIRNLVLWSPSCPPGAWTGGPYLSDDGLHPNARGDEYLAGVVRRSLLRLFGPTLQSTP
jgi:acyl-CoA thioesterase I